MLQCSFNICISYVVIFILCLYTLVLMVRWCRNMKICLRYPYPKSFPSGKGLAIAPLQVFLCLYFYLYSRPICLLSFRPSEASGEICYIVPTYKSFISGFIVLIKFSFFSLLHFLICFSLSIAWFISENIS